MATPPPLNNQPTPPELGLPPHVDRQTLIWLFFRFDGRVGRQVYWLSIIFLTALIGATAPFTIDPETGVIDLAFGPVQSFVYTISTISSLTISIKRLHDLNMSGFFALGLLFFPIAFIMSLWLGIRGGDKGPNRFGWEADIRPTQPPPVMPDNDDDKDE